MSTPIADICLIIEGSYPYVPGGVAVWTHELIQKHAELTFHIVSIQPRDEEPQMQFTLPPNVKGLTRIHLQRLPQGKPLPEKRARELFEKLRQPLINITTSQSGLEDFRQMMAAIAPYQHSIGSDVMLDSEASWALLSDMYEASFAESSMLDYFWSWRAVMGGLYSLIVAELPQARCYHALSTGYAGVLAARAKIETSRPVILTEHGIYTNERRIEISSADWLEETASKALTIDSIHRSLRDFWAQAFANYSRICYQGADKIITLFSGNQQAQVADGADAAKMAVIPNGIDVERFSEIKRRDHSRPTVALIGRVVPVKDIKSLLRAAASLHRVLPDLRVLIMGPEDEDPDYARECRDLADYFALGKTVEFTGRVDITQYLPDIDVLALSSISEAQPLSILEAGAAGIPCVTTDVGACREMLMGKPGETPSLPPGGIVVPLANPQALSKALLKLLTDRDFYASCSKAMRIRVSTYYNKNDQQRAYHALYDQYLKQ